MIAMAQAQSPQTGLHYYCIQDLETGEVILRGQAGSNGVAHSSSALLLAPNKRYRHWILQASTLLVGYSDFTSGPSGRGFLLPDTILGTSPSLDSDGDGLHDDGELVMGTHAENPDTDGDGAFDGTEVLLGRAP